MAMDWMGSPAEGSIVSGEEQSSPSPTPEAGGWRPEGLVLTVCSGALVVPTPPPILWGLHFLLPVLCKLLGALDPARAACPCSADSAAILDI